MTEKIYTEKEVEERVKFKLNSFITWLDNTKNWDYKSAYSAAFSGQIQNSKDLYNVVKIKESIIEALKKEISMAYPYKGMEEMKIKIARDKAVEDIANYIMKKCGVRTRISYDYIVDIVETLITKII